MRSFSWLLFTIFSLLLSCLLLVRTSETDGAETQDGASILGHLEPLGSRNIKHSLEVIQNFPDPKTFFETYVVPGRPVLIQNAAKLSTAFHKWSDEYFLSRPEANEVKIQVEQRKKEERTGPYAEIPFSEFVKSYKEKDVYMVSSVPEFMKSDVLLPSPLLCRDITETSDMLTDAVMWFSSGGTKSVLHFDDGLENINCLFAGTKELLFIDYHKYKHVVPIDFPEGRYSGVDVDRVDFVKYPGLINVEYYNVTLKAGDCLYIPHRWFHQVRSYNRNIAVNLWWKYTPNFVPEDCDGMEQNQTLDKFTFTTVEKLIDQPEETLMNHLEHFLGKSVQISFKTFVQKLRKDPYFGNNNVLTWTEDMKSTTKKLFKLMDTDEDKSFSSADLEELEKADDETIRALTNEYFRLGDLMERAQEKLQENDELNEEDYEDGAGDGDYDIHPVKRSGKRNSKEEL